MVTSFCSFFWFPSSFLWEEHPGRWLHRSLLYSLQCSETGPAGVIWVDKTNISCCCWGTSPWRWWEALVSNRSRWQGPGTSPSSSGRPDPQAGSQALNPWAAGHRILCVGRRNESMPCSAILSAHWKGDLWWQSGGGDSLSSKWKLWEASAWDPDLTRI